MNQIAILPLRLAGYLKHRLKSSPGFMRVYKKLYGNIENKLLFSDLYQHDKMLADSVRNDAYYRAIAKYVNEGDVVIDLGTGTGVLSFLAASKNPKKVYAIDHSNIIEKARFIAERNNIQKIQFIKINSWNFNLPDKVDVILHEQIGEYLFEENMVSNLINLRDRLLKTGGRILPNRFELFIEPVQLKDDYRVPFIWENRVGQVKYDGLKDYVKKDVGKSYYRRMIDPSHVAHFLCNPEKLVVCDLETMKESDLPKTLGYRRNIVRDGRLDGFCLYFNAMFDDDINFSTSPRGKKRAGGYPY